MCYAASPRTRRPTPHSAPSSPPTAASGGRAARRHPGGFRLLSLVAVARPARVAANQVAAAQAFQTRFDKNPASIKPEALAERAVPAWLSGNSRPSARLSPPAPARNRPLWLRTRIGQTAAVARALGDCAAPGAAQLSCFGFKVLGSEPKTQNPESKAAIFAALRYTGSRDLFHTEAFQTGLFEIQDLAFATRRPRLRATARSGVVGRLCRRRRQDPAPRRSDAEQGPRRATDRSARRLSLLQRRAARAQVF